MFRRFSPPSQPKKARAFTISGKLKHWSSNEIRRPSAHKSCTSTKPHFHEVNNSSCRVSSSHKQPHPNRHSKEKRFRRIPLGPWELRGLFLVNAAVGYSGRQPIRTFSLHCSKVKRQAICQPSICADYRLDIGSTRGR